MIVKSGKGFNIDAVARKLAAAKRGIKLEMGKMAVNHFKGSFRDQGFTNTSIDPWKARKKNSNQKKGRAILVQSGALRRGIRLLGTPGDRVIIGTRGIRYAKIHNEGLMGKAFGKYSFKMPKRQFLGNSRKLETQIFIKTNNRIKKIWA